MARKVDARDAGPDAAPALEGPGEPRAFTWIEVVALDGAGAPAGPVRRATSESGRAGAFDGLARETGELDLFVRDDEEPGIGAGSRLVRITVRPSGVDAPVVLAPRGVGRAVPDAVGAAGAAAVLYADLHDHTAFIPLDASRSPAGPASTEPLLDRARPLVLSASGPHLLAAFPETGLAKGLTCR
jgi:hypothetical protein